MADVGVSAHGRVHHTEFADDITFLSISRTKTVLHMRAFYIISRYVYTILESRTKRQTENERGKNVGFIEKLDRVKKKEEKNKRGKKEEKKGFYVCSMHAARC